MMNSGQENNNERIAKIRARRQGREARKAPEPVRMQTFTSYDREKEDYLDRSKKKGKFDARWISGFLALVFGAAAGCYAFLPQFRFDQITITGMEKISKEEIVYFTGARGKPVFTIDPSDVRETLLRHYHDVYDADVLIDFPAEMTITLQERIPVVEWDFGGSKFWIDQQGTVLNESNSQREVIHVYADAYPGAISQQDRDIPSSFSKDVLHTIETMGKYAPKDRPLYFTYKNGFGWDTDEGWRIFFGKTDTDMDEKLRMQASLTKYFLEKEIQPVFVSLEYKDAPYYRFVEN